MGKYSKQRELILNAVQENRIHPTADTVYSMLKEANPGLSLGTVYRNLNLLAGEGRIRKILMAGGPDRFDGELSEHFHMVCNCCGEMVDLPPDSRLDLCNLECEIGKATGLEITSHRLTFFGVCKACRQKTDTKQVI